MCAQIRVKQILLENHLDIKIELLPLSQGKQTSEKKGKISLVFKERSFFLKLSSRTTKIDLS